LGKYGGLVNIGYELIHMLQDDLWRRNYDTINALNLHAQDFNPHYPTSIAYNPLPRAALEDFLRQRGLMSTPSLSTDFFYSGFLNKIYFRLNELVFRGSGDVSSTFLLGTREKFLLFVL